MRRIGLRLRSYLFVQGLAAVGAAAVAAGAVQLGLDYWLRLRLDMRAAMLGVVVIGLGVLAWRRVWRPLRVAIGPAEVAGIIERRFPELHSVLVSAVRFSMGQAGPRASNSPELMRVVMERAVEQASRLPVEGVLNPGPARRTLVHIVLVAAVVVGAFAVRPEVMGMWFDRNVLLSDREWPKRTRLVVHLADAAVTRARGDDVEIRATAEGVVPRSVDVEFEFEGQGVGRDTMVRVGSRGFRHTFARAERPFRFRLVGGDDVTRWYRVDLADRPRVAAAEVTVSPPAYANLERVALPAGQRVAEVLTGSDVTLKISVNKPVVRASLIEGRDVVAEAEGSGLEWLVTLRPERSATYHFALVDALDLTNKQPARFSIQLVKDDAPRVQMKIPGTSDVLTPQAVLPVELSFSDTYGLAEVAMVYVVARDETPVSESLEGFRPGATQFDAKRVFSVEDLGLVPGDRLTLYAEAADYDNINGPNRSKSSAATFRILSTDELLAELARREQEYRQEFEKVIDRQEGLRNNLLSIMRTIDDESVAHERDDRIAAAERRQRQVGSQVNLVRQQFEQILSEMHINGLDTASARRRLVDGVIRPLNALVRRGLPSAMDRLREFGRAQTDASAKKADDAQAAVITDMRNVLANMLKWEGYQEAITMLREILRLQEELNKGTAEEAERRAAEILQGD